MHSVTNLRLQLGQPPIIQVLSANTISLQALSTKGFKKNLHTHTCFVVSGPPDSYLQQLIVLLLLYLSALHGRVTE